MRVAKLTSARKIEMFEEDIPKIKNSDDVLVQVKAVGICGTDLHIFQGERADVQLPRVMGHELSGIVQEVGSNVTGLKVGDRVALDPVFACNVCNICATGHENVCDNVKCFGVQMDGGFQDYIVVGEKHLYAFDPSITFEQAALAEPFSIAANIHSRTMTTAEDKVVIMGSGTIGLALVQAAKGIGAKVLVSDVVDTKLQKAKDCGADVVVNSKNESLAEAVQKFSPGGASVIIDAVGIAPLLEQSIELAAPVARVAVIGFDGKAAQIPPVKITKKELTLVGARMNCHKFPMVMEWLNEGKINADLMISKQYSVNDIQKAFEETLANGGNIVKTVITF
ncbi:alcohol dehydrogenase catalytic domain-containing protein [Clostridium grantii]|uniref:L-gulonate 5-dehydrogenase n=1 Tax=Clostridium grantii DSM 8605 TaxID=1121316 RepID=A0A1M5UTQ7_9CLOT|nr:alcohol dehydrogenase catalytic domain-containing protein [Clostridium grantii]SHH66290.1 L-gulonate 5-dehydrogenase [Clostridium grantii DSM 8605]